MAAIKPLLLKPHTNSVRKLRTSGALQGLLIWVFWFDLVVYVARPVVLVL